MTPPMRLWLQVLLPTGRGCRFCPTPFLLFDAFHEYLCGVLLQPLQLKEGYCTVKEGRTNGVKMVGQGESK